MKRISVIVPVYNTALFLRRCVDSILVQQELLKEVILVDDGSTDESGAICDEYAAAYPHIVRVFHQVNQGAGASRNLGLEHAGGEFLSFIDSDDYVEPDMYAGLLNLADEYGADMATGAIWIEQMDGTLYSHVSKSVRCCWNTREALVELNSYNYYDVSFCSSIIKRSAFDGLRFPLMRQCEDYALLYQVMAACRKVAYCSKPVYHYVQRPNSVSRTVNISLLPIEVAGRQLAFFREKFADIAYVAETDYAFIHMGIYSAYARNGILCPKDLLKKLQGESRRYLGTVLKNPHIPRIKKLQAIVFCVSPRAYKFVIKRRAHR